MKKLGIFCFLFLTTTVVAFSQSRIQAYKSVSSTATVSTEKDCNFDKCLEHCVNNKKICSIWDKNGFMDVYHKVYALNKDITIFDKIKVGSRVTFPPFGRYEQVIGKKTVLIVQRDEDVWVLIHRYLKENYLFNLDVGKRGVDDKWDKKTGKKELAFGSTTIYW